MTTGGFITMLTIIALICISIFAMPLYGVFLITDPGQSENRMLGWVLFIIGIIVYYGLGGR